MTLALPSPLWWRGQLRVLEGREQGCASKDSARVGVTAWTDYWTEPQPPWASKSVVLEEGKEDNAGIKEKPIGRKNKGAGKLSQKWRLVPLWTFPWWRWTVLVREAEKPEWMQPQTWLGTWDSVQRVSGAERGSTHCPALQPLRWCFPTSVPHLPHCNRSTHLPTCSGSNIWRLCT